MICPQCETAGERSRVYPGGTEVTLLTASQYWDEDGVFVEDDPNTRTQSFSCSNGHNWRTHTLRGAMRLENLADTPPS